MAKDYCYVMLCYALNPAYNGEHIICRGERLRGKEVLGDKEARDGQIRFIGRMTLSYELDCMAMHIDHYVIILHLCGG